MRIARPMWLPEAPVAPEPATEVVDETPAPTPAMAPAEPPRRQPLSAPVCTGRGFIGPAPACLSYLAAEQWEKEHRPQLLAE